MPASGFAAYPGGLPTPYFGAQAGPAAWYVAACTVRTTGPVGQTPKAAVVALKPTVREKS